MLGQGRFWKINIFGIGEKQVSGLNPQDGPDDIGGIAVCAAQGV